MHPIQFLISRMPLFPLFFRNAFTFSRKTLRLTAKFHSTYIYIYLNSIFNISIPFQNSYTSLSISFPIYHHCKLKKKRYYYLTKKRAEKRCCNIYVHIIESNLICGSIHRSLLDPFSISRKRTRLRFRG